MLNWGMQYLTYVGLFAFFVPATCFVGNFDTLGFKLNEKIRINDGLSHQTDSGCYVGKANNLVIHPYPGKWISGKENLQVHKAEALCLWLAEIRTQHQIVKTAWEERQLARRRQISRFNIFRRIREYFRTFPAIEVYATVKYVNFENTDNFGYPLPWMQATFEYKQPDDVASVGLFDHLVSRRFGEYDYHGEGMDVILLLSPHPNYNQDLNLSASKQGAVLEAFRGFNTRRKNQDRSHDDTEVGNFVNLYDVFSSKMDIKGKIEDFWHNGARCYFKPVFSVEWTFSSDNICDVLGSKAASGVLHALTASHLNTVVLHVTGFDLFNHVKPRLYATMNEGLIGSTNRRPSLVVEVDTNPQNIPDFEQAKTIAASVRAAGFIADGLKSLTKNNSASEKSKKSKKSKKNLYPDLTELGSPSGPPYPVGSPSGPPYPVGSPSGFQYPVGSPSGFQYPVGSHSGPPYPVGVPIGMPQPPPPYPVGDPKHPMPPKPKNPAYGFRADLLEKAAPIGFEGLETTDPSEFDRPPPYNPNF